MRGGEEDGKGRDDGEHGEETEAHPVDDHRRELPVAALVLETLVVAQLGRDRPQFAEDALQQADDRRPAAAAAAAAAWNSVCRSLPAVEERSGRRRRVREPTRRAVTTAGARPAVRPSTVGAQRVVVEHPGGAANSAGCGAVEPPIVVLEVENVGQ